VNWAGHKLGYRNYDSDDQSKNTLIVDVLTMGELFQNNHHKWGQSPNFAVRAFELDPAYQIMRVLAAVGIIDMSKSQKARWVPQPRKAAVSVFGGAPPPPAAVSPAPLLTSPMNGE
jgi:stearoyl-CoA desaturase (delta-9 desaturase)